jgi:hypothetical protein
MIDKDTYIEIAGKIADGTASEREIELYNAYFNAYQLKYPSWNELGELQRKEMIDEAEDGIHVQLRHNDDKKSVWLGSRVAVAAAAVAAIVLGVYFFNAIRHANTPRHPELVSGSQDIAPGKNGATITLANGKVIQLSDAKSGVVVGEGDLKYDDGSPLSPQGGSLPEGEGSMMLTASTAKGQTYRFTLPDGTKVWLNADSKLEFPSNFVNGKTRSVKLSGEGYFEVAKDKAHPFMVNFKTLTLTVLGTHFNVNAYENEKIAKATLLEGSIKIEKLFLKPDQQAVFDDHKRLSLQTLENAEKEIAWKDGYFRFYDEKIESIMKKLERWYDIEVVYEGRMTSEGFTGKVSRNKNISQVLMILEKTKGVHFKIEGRRVTVID